MPPDAPVVLAVDPGIPSTVEPPLPPPGREEEPPAILPVTPFGKPDDPGMLAAEELPVLSPAVVPEQPPTIPPVAAVAPSDDPGMPTTVEPPTLPPVKDPGEPSAIASDCFQSTSCLIVLLNELGISFCF